MHKQEYFLENEPSKFLLDFKVKNGSPKQNQKTRTSFYNQEEKEKSLLNDFAIPAENRVKMKGRQKLKKLWNTIRRPGDQRLNQDGPDGDTAKISLNTLKSHEVLRKVFVPRNFSENNQLRPV